MTNTQTYDLTHHESPIAHKASIRSQRLWVRLSLGTRKFHFFSKFDVKTPLHLKVTIALSIEAQNTFFHQQEAYQLGHHNLAAFHLLSKVKTLPFSGSITLMVCLLKLNFLIWRMVERERQLLLNRQLMATRLSLLLTVADFLWTYQTFRHW